MCLESYIGVEIVSDPFRVEPIVHEHGILLVHLVDQEVGIGVNRGDGDMPSGSDPHRTFAPSTPTSPGLTACWPNSENRNAEP